MTEDGDEALVCGADRTRPFPRPLSGEEQVRKECGFSQALVDDLKAHRLQIARAHLAEDFAVAFDLALYALSLDLFDRGWRSRPLDLRAVETRPIFTERSRPDFGRPAARGANKRFRSIGCPCRRPKGSRRSRPWRPRPSRTFSPGASRPRSSRSSPSRTAPIPSSKLRSGSSRSRLTTSGGRPPPITGDGPRRHTGSRSPKMSSGNAGRRTTRKTKGSTRRRIGEGLRSGE